MRYLDPGYVWMTDPYQEARMRKVIRRVARKVPVLNLESLCFEPQPLDPATFAILLDSLYGRIQQKRHQKMVAAWILSRAELTPEQRIEACAALSNVLLPARSKGLIPSGLIPGRTVGMIVLISIGTIGLAAFADYDIAIGLGAMWVSLMPYSLPLVEFKQRKDVAVPVQAAIGRMQVRQSVDILAGLWMGGYDRVNARAALDKAFLALSDDDYGRMDAKTLPRLQQLLDWYLSSIGRNEWNVDRALHLLHAFACIGDKRVIPAILKLTVRANEPNATREMAAQVAAHLEERNRREEHRTVLLRGSSAGGGDEALLRASQNLDSAPDPSVLVRAVGNEDQTEQIIGTSEF